MTYCIKVRTSTGDLICHKARLPHCDLDASYIEAFAHYRNANVWVEKEFKR